MIEVNELIEFAFVYSDYKGIPKQQVRKALASGKDVVMRLDVQGAETVRRLAPEALLIFLMAGDEGELADRLHAPHRDAQPESRGYRAQAAALTEFDYVIANRTSALDDAVDAVLQYCARGAQPRPSGGSV
jgi:guanylate kinase